VFFTNSGAEANEGAIKLVRKWGQLHKGGASKIITFNNGFHAFFRSRLSPLLSFHTSRLWIRSRLFSFFTSTLIMYPTSAS